MSNTIGQPEQYILQLGDRGRIVLPATVREQLNLKEGDRLVLTLEADGSLRLTSLRELVAHLDSQISQ